MKRYITRHGQLIERDMLPANIAAKFPPGEKPLSLLGREQAKLLGEKLLSLGFHGRIISSPFYRTLETAEIIADLTGSVIVPFAPVRERMREDEVTNVAEFRGFGMDEIRKLFRHIDPDVQLEDEWWRAVDGSVREETQAEVNQRVSEGYEYINNKYKDEELLIMSHAASSCALFKYLHLYSQELERTSDKRLLLRTMPFNCSLSVIDPDDDQFVPVYCDVSHIPYEKTTSNFLTREAWDNDYFDSEYGEKISIPEGFSNITGKIILHIGDTLSKHYPFYRKLIEIVKPNIILHTGDMADEVKAGRIKSAAYEYRSKVEKLLGIMKASGARLMIVPGNNDLPDVIRELAPDAELYPQDAVIDFDGIQCRIGHAPLTMHHDMKWSFYGHSLREDDWSADNNEQGGYCRFNCIKGPYVCDTGDGRFYRFTTPEDI